MTRTRVFSFIPSEPTTVETTTTVGTSTMPIPAPTSTTTKPTPGTTTTSSTTTIPTMTTSTTSTTTSTTATPTTTTTTTMVTTTTEQSKLGCPDKSVKFDLAIVIDHSNSIGRKNFELMRNFLIDLVDSFDIDGGQVKISLVPYSSATLPIDHFNELKSSEQVKDTLRTTPYKGGHTATGRALTDVKKEVFKRSTGNRPDAKKVTLVVTDGVTTIGEKPGEPAKALRNDGVDVFALGIKGAKEEELLSMTGEDREKMFQIKDFKELSEDIAESIVKAICASAA